MLVDQEQKGAVDGEADLGGQRHEAHRGHSCRLGAFFVHCDGALVLELFKLEKQVSDSMFGTQG